MSYLAEAERAPTVPAGLAALPTHGPVTCEDDRARDASAALLPHPTLQGGVYLAARYGLGAIVSLGNMLVMTWWIGPHAYGVFVTAIGLVAFLATLARLGVDIYLVRREPAPDARAYGVAGTLILAASAGLALLGAALAPVLMHWYGSREFVTPYLVLLLSIPVVGLTGIPTAKLERELNFRRLAGIELAGQVLGLAAAAILAGSGAGVWAPVAGQITWQASLLIAACVSAGFVPRMSFDRRLAREMLSYGVGITVSLRTWQLRTLVNPLLVGRFAGVESVAFVALAIRIAEALGSIRLAAGRLALAALARLQDQHQQFRAALERALYLQVMTLGPLLCGFALLGPLIVRHVIGATWLPSLTVYPFVAVGVLINAVYNLQASALFVHGRQWVVTRAYTIHVVLLAAATPVLIFRLGIAGYGWAELLACAGYWSIHTGLAETVTVTYRKLVPWLAIFFVLLFLPFVIPARVWLFSAVELCCKPLLVRL